MNHTGGWSNNDEDNSCSSSRSSMRLSGSEEDEMVPAATGHSRQRRIRKAEGRHPSSLSTVEDDGGFDEGNGRRGGLNLGAVDEAFGPKTDLYRDVLGVKPNASPEQIQKAYFQRRNELFRLLSDLDTQAESTSRFSSGMSKRKNAEAKMDAVVMAMRVLGDPSLRSRYDDVRTDRLRGRMNISPVRPQRLFVSHGTEFDEAFPDETELPVDSLRKRTSQQKRDQSQPVPAVSSRAALNSVPKPGAPHDSKSSRLYMRMMVPVLERSNRGSARRNTGENKVAGREATVVTPEKPSARKGWDMSASGRGTKQEPIAPVSLRKNSNSLRQERGIRFDMDLREYPASEGEDTTADDTMNWTDEGTLMSETSDGTALKDKGFVERVSDELCGAVEDTAKSFDQVFNVFTLQEEDIRAVRYRIDKFREQISHSL